MPRLTFRDVSESRVNNFVFIRFLLALAVILRHAFIIAGGPYGYEPVNELTHGQSGSLGAGINFFFIISGFLVTGAWLRRPSVPYYLKRRIMRLYPGVVAMAVVCIFLFGPLCAGNIPAFFHSISPRYTLRAVAHLMPPELPGVFSNLPFPDAVNGSMWSLLYQFRCYLVVILLGVCGLYRRREIVLGLLLVCFAIFMARTYTGVPVISNVPRPIVGDLSEWPRFLCLFISGMVFYLYRDKIPYHRNLFILSVVGLIASCWGGYAIALPVLGGYAIFYTAFSKRLPAQKFAHGNDYSYGMYIYSFPVQQVFQHFYGGHLTVWPLLAMSLPVTLAFAALSWHLVEKPSTKSKSKRVEASASEKPVVPVESEAVREATAILTHHP